MDSSKVDETEDTKTAELLSENLVEKSSSVFSDNDLSNHQFSQNKNNNYKPKESDNTNLNDESKLVNEVNIILNNLEENNTSSNECLKNEPIIQNDNNLNQENNLVNKNLNDHANKNVNNHLEANSSISITNVKLESQKMKEYLKKAVKSTYQYNKQINQERKDERRICLDLQTYTLHYPVGLGIENRMLKKYSQNVELNYERSRYPIAVLPGHYQNHYRKYKSHELKYFPINTVLYGPVITDTDTLPPLLTRIEEDSYSETDSVSETSTQHSCCCDEKSCKKLKLENNLILSENTNELCDCESSSSEEEEDERPPPLPILMKHFENRPNAVCSICKKNNMISNDNLLEKLIHCSDCEISMHPSCLEMSTEMIDVIKTYPWQCMNCKTCVYCLKAYYESNMMFCDKCDRGYHTFCVGLKQIPVGKWVCKLCAICANCGATTPGKSARVDWHHETLKINTSSGTLRRHQLLCSNCSKSKRSL